MANESTKQEFIRWIQLQYTQAKMPAPSGYSDLWLAVAWSMSGGMKYPLRPFGARDFIEVDIEQLPWGGIVPGDLSQADRVVVVAHPADIAELVGGMTESTATVQDAADFYPALLGIEKNEPFSRATKPTKIITSGRVLAGREPIMIESFLGMIASRYGIQLEARREMPAHGTRPAVLAPTVPAVTSSVVLPTTVDPPPAVA